MSGRLTKPVLVVFFSALALSVGAFAGSLTPPGAVGSTMHSLANIYDSIASATFDSSGIVANQNGSLMGVLKYIEANGVLWASGSNNIWNLNSGNVGIGTTTPLDSIGASGVTSATGIEIAGPAGGRAFLELSAMGSSFDTIRFSSGSTGLWDINRTATTQDFMISRSTNGISFEQGTFTILNANGNVGIGTVTPSQKLQVAGGSFLVSQSGTPVQVASLSDGQQINSLVVDGQYMYVTNSNAGAVQIYDISRPSSPSLKSTITCSGCGGELQDAVSDGYLYIQSGLTTPTYNLRVYDVSVPSTPKLVFSGLPNFYNSAMAISGKYMYVAGHFTGSRIYDISNPHAVKVASTPSTNGNSVGVAVQGKLMFLIHFNTGIMRILDVSSPTNPTVLSDSCGASCSGVHGITLSGHYAFLGGNFGVRVYDFSNPASPSAVSTMSAGGGFVYSPAVAGHYVYATSSEGVYIYDISDIANPVLVSSYPLSATLAYQHSVVRGKYLYSTFGNRGVRIFDIAGADIPAISGGAFSFDRGDINGLLNAESMNIRSGLDVRNGILSHGAVGIYASSSAEPALRISQGISTGGDILSLASSISTVFRISGVGNIIASHSGQSDFILRSARFNGPSTDNGGLFTIRASAGAGFDTLQVLNGSNANLFTIASSGNVGIGTTAPSTRLTVSNTAGASAILASSSTNASFNAFSSNGSTGTYMTSYRTNANTHTEVLGFAGRGTAASPLALSSGDDILYLGGLGYTGAAFTVDTVAVITFEAAGNFNATSAPTNMMFSTTASGSVSPSERMRIDSNGNVGIGTTVPGARLSISGTASISGNFGINTNKFYVNATSGNVGIGTKNLTTDTFELFGTASVSGQIRARGGITSPGTGTNSEQFGNNANASGNSGLAIGNGAIAATLNSTAIGNSAVAQTGTGAMAIGFGASATGPSSIAIYGNAAGNSAVSIGGSSNAPGLSSIIIGSNASGSAGAISQIGLGANTYLRGSRAIAIGSSAMTRANDVIAIGSGVHADAGQIVMGSTTTLLSNLFFNYSSSSAPGAFTINGTRGAGTDIAGANLVLAGGAGTGTGRGGSLVFQTADSSTTGTGLNSLVTRMTIVASGSIGIGTTTPTALLEVNGTASISNGFFVSSVGNVGIGTTNPIRKLDIYGSNWVNGSGGDLRSIGTGTVGGALTLISYPNSVSVETVFSILATGPGAPMGTGSFAIWDNQQLAYRFVVNANGNVGIGTTTPTALLEVEGTASVANSLFVSPSGYTGNVGIGTPAPDNVLEVRGTFPQFSLNDGTFISAMLGGTGCQGGEACFGVSSVLGTVPVQVSLAASTSSFVIRANSHIGFGTDNPTAFVHISSKGFDGQALLRLEDTNSTCDFTANAGGPTCGSDIRLKKDITAISDGVLDKLLAVHIVNYRWKTDAESAGVQTGFIAQNVQEYFPDLVATASWIDGKPALFLSQNAFIPYLVKGIQELTASSLLLDQLLTADSISTEPSGPLARLVHNVLAFIEDVFHVRIGDGEVKADRLCAGDVCVNSEQLLRMLEKSGMSSDMPAATPTPPPSDMPPASATPDAPTPIPENTQLPAETATPTPSATPVATPIPSDTPSPEATATP